MAGYDNYSMSNNAIKAYEDGEKPLSKWRKTDIIEEIEFLVEEGEIELKCSMNTLKKASLQTLKQICLVMSSWHHTSSHYNRTDFYYIDTFMVSLLTDEDIKRVEQDNREKRAKQQPTEEKWKCTFLEWSGSRNHPKATEKTEVGIIKGEWFFRANGKKKSINANGFRKIEKISE